jgi:hypothetical protein
MSLINTYYNNAELSMASYAVLEAGVPNIQALQHKDVGETIGDRPRF